MRPCGFYPLYAESDLIEWEELELPLSLRVLLQGGNGRFQFFDFWNAMLTAAGGRGGYGDVISDDVGARASIIAGMAALGYEPYLPALIFPSDIPAPPWRFLDLYARVSSSLLQEHIYQEAATRWLILFTMERVYWALVGEEFSGHRPERNAQIRERVAAIMPVLCSVWPYYEALRAAEENDEPYVDWARVASTIRLQGR